MTIENFIDFENVSFTYPAVEGDVDADGKQIVPQPVFDHFTASLPGGFTSLIGPNGSGKSTFLMLASGRLVPQEGSVRLFGKQIPLLDEEKKNLLASVIYQNMEFETEEKVEQLLHYVYEHGALNARASAIKSGGDLYDEVISTFELKSVMKHGLTKLSKGEIQRTLLAFSLLYGSKSVFMDEPLFAMEEPQKEKALEYLHLFCEKNQRRFIFQCTNSTLQKNTQITFFFFTREETCLSAHLMKSLQKKTLKRPTRFLQKCLKTKKA